MIYANLCVLVSCLAAISDAANVLYVIPFSAMSHYINLRPIGLELARRGHNVTVVTTHKEVDHPPSYHEVIVDNKSFWDLLGDERPNVFTMVDLSTEEYYNVIWKGGLAYTELTLNSSNVQKFLREDHKFDLVISEQFFHEATYVLAHKYNAPLALVTTFGNCMRHNIVTRNPVQLSNILLEMLMVRQPATFWGRFKNLYYSLYEYVWWKYWYLGEQEKLVKKYIPDLKEPVPSLFELQRDTALMLYNSHFSFDDAVAYAPNIIEIGGVHLSKSDGKLPNDLKEILDGAKHGVVYVNFGSNVKSSELPLDKKNAFIKVFRELKQTVIWKWEDEKLENMPKNLIIRKWLPQKEILSHPNIKVFISHGGLLGTQEAIFHGIPIIGVPVYGDQYNNLLQTEEMGFGQILEFKDINEDNLRKKLNNILNDDNYGAKAREVSARFRDRPMSALDTAVFWIEYVIRNKGAPYMKNSALKLDWVASNMIDVYAFIVIVILAIIFAFIKIASILIKLLVNVQGKKVNADRRKVKQKRN
ncbi:UDP-glycosyltransferase UGT5-like isoform X2 [Plodia interpunctella]|uniref:UDP-glycosyltransferase UGT5-like isoform X2 n=1 Tax=Plodia interpunctella TaxID=58824 RepID=UPI0023687ECE|nr:UDP-glycosyltransferase UGT5-like isoform X2 [Plodia interpunctella]